MFKLKKIIVFFILVCFFMFAYVGCGVENDNSTRNDSTEEGAYDSNGKDESNNSSSGNESDNAQAPNQDGNVTIEPETIIDSGKLGDGLTWSITDKGTLTVSGAGEMPKSINYKSYPWRKYVNDIKKVIIEDEVTSIETGVFSFCEKLSSVVIGEGVTRIGDGAFQGCVSLRDIAIPKSVAKIGEFAFYECVSLENVIIPEGITKICTAAFKNCSTLRSVTIPSSVTVIENEAFSGCKKINAVYITSIESWLGISFFSNPLWDGANLYVENKLLTHLVISDGTTDIGYGAFAGCISLVSVEVPKSITSIGNDAFHGCYKLVEVINKSNLNIGVHQEGNGYIGDYALEVHSGNSRVVNKDGYLFYTCNGDNYLLGCVEAENELVLPENYNGENYDIRKSAFYKNDKITKVDIPNGVENIGDSAFSYCENLVSVTIGRNVKSIGNYAFKDCNYLVEVINHSSLNIEEGSESDGKVAYYAIEVHSEKSKIAEKDDCLWYTTESGVNYVFQYKGKSSDVVLPKNYNGEPYEMHKYMFSSYNNLNSIYINCNSIVDSAFSDCFSLTTVAIGDDVKSIGYYAFYSCDNLNSVTIGNSVTEIGGNAFWKCNKLTSIVIPNSVTSIGDEAFYECEELTSVTIGDGVKTIEAKAFYKCTKLENVTIGNNVTCIEERVFAYCERIKNIVLPNSLMSIGDAAFCWCESLTNINIGNNVVSIGNYVFENTSLVDVVIGDGVKSIGNMAFNQCSELKSVTISNSVTNIGRSVFYSCSALTSITYKGTKAEWEEISKDSDWAKYSSIQNVKCTDGDINLGK